jgi:hypothetical protein
MSNMTGNRGERLRYARLSCTVITVESGCVDPASEVTKNDGRIEPVSSEVMDTSGWLRVADPMKSRRARAGTCRGCGKE